jgi:hypothetical protein
MILVLANAGLPMIGVQMSLMLIALLPIIVIESVVLRTIVAQPVARCAFASLISNLSSTLIGVPMTWFLLVLVQMAVGGGEAWGLESPLNRIAAVTLQAPWLLPYEGNLQWMVPAASLTLLFPFLATSALIEGTLLVRLFPASEPRRVWRATWIGNGISYAGLIGYAGLKLFLAVGP